MHQIVFNHSRTSHRALILLTKTCLTTPQLKQLHSHLTVSGAIGDTLTARKLAAQLAVSDYSHAWTFLRHLPSKSGSIWTSSIRSLCENHHSENAISLANHMVRSGCYPDNYTFSFVFRACAEISDVASALMFHSLAVKLGWAGYDYVVNCLIHCYIGCDAMDNARKVFDESSVRDVITWTAVINGYFKIGQLELAQKMFDEMPQRNEVSWSAMINGYAQMGMFMEALEAFNEMLASGVKPNQSGLVGAISACTHLGSLDQGRWIHAYIDRNAIQLDGVVGTALVDMYAKCGSIDIARDLFEKIPRHERYAHAYTSLITGLANHGESRAPLELFRIMEEDGVCPSEATFVSVLSACSRIGLAEEGLRIFRRMEEVYGIVPGVRHYGCLVDMLARAGQLEEADEVVRRMPMEPSLSALGALLNACRVHGDVNLGKRTVDELSERSLDHSGVHVLLSNIYASLDKWNEVAGVRARMAEKRVQKVAGCSCIEVEGKVVEFVAGEKCLIDMNKMDETIAALVRVERHSKSLCT
ncbi:pentatricopeptide repeat-containing protein At5g48910-like [Andrographis paniculata]|uniref:pentatricopeptide repeat-containing protein At5g48910-like n=1 Tax=Andrographis paniculata TaxID=175694 RepID=UPI0021E94F25|nr:pentatricopeptide repeat-containing protein At5g48910-like [Andrographis paniculata]